MSPQGYRFFVHESVPAGDGGISFGQAVVAGFSRFLDQSVFIAVLCLFNRLIIMCLAIPAKIMSLEGTKAHVDFGQGVLREVNVSLVEAKVGEYVLVHAGYAIQVLEEKEALETLSLWNDVLASAGE